MQSRSSKSLGNSSLNSSRSLKSKLANGSSNNIKSESFTNALAKAVLCCCPPDSSSGFYLAWLITLKVQLTFPLFALISSGFTPIIFSGEAIFSKTVKLG
jgi:hypothetical protein